MKRWLPKIHRKGQTELGRCSVSNSGAIERICVCARAHAHSVMDSVCVCGKLTTSQSVCLCQIKRVIHHVLVSVRRATPASKTTHVVGLISPIEQKLCAGMRLYVNTFAVSEVVWSPRRVDRGREDRMRVQRCLYASSSANVVCGCAPLCVCTTQLCIHPHFFELLLWSLPFSCLHSEYVSTT